MTIVIAQFVVLLLGTVVFALIVWGLVVPEKLVTLVSSAMDRPWGLHLAVFARLVLGTAMIIVAPASRFPTAFQVIGIIALLAAIGLAAVGRARVRQLLTWFVERFSPLAIRMMLLLGVAFVAFLVYGVL